MLTELLSRATPLRVLEVRDGMLIEPNHVYVIPPNANMAVLHGRLSLMPRTEIRGQHMPIDFFFRSLADDQKSRAIGVILSGTASDGTEGLRAIKVEGGLTFSQDEQSAKYDGMPHSAIAAGVVDFVLSPEGIARELTRIGRHPYVTLAPAPGRRVIPGGEADLSKVFVLLRSATGVDFACISHPRSSAGLSAAWFCTKSNRSPTTFVSLGRRRQRSTLCTGMCSST
jgi:two-component system CheB/CheR fusion protein